MMEGYPFNANMPLLEEGSREFQTRRSSQARRKSSVFRSNLDLSAALGTESILLKLSHKRSEEELEKVRNFMLETDGLKQLCTTIPKLAVDELCHFVKIEDFSAEEVICKEGESGDKFYFILSGTATEYKSMHSLEKTQSHLHRIDDSTNERVRSPDGSTKRSHVSNSRSSTDRNASVSKQTGSTQPETKSSEGDGGATPKGFRGVRTIQMPFLRVDMSENEASREEQEQLKMEQERLRMLSGLYASSPPRGGEGRDTSPTRSVSPEAKEKKESPEQMRKASIMLRSRAMSRRESISIRSQRKSRFVSQFGGRMSMISPGSYRARQFTTTATPALIEHGLKYGNLSAHDSFGELMIFQSTEKHKLSVVAGNDGCLVLTFDRGTVSRIHNYLASEGRLFLQALKLWASRRILKKPTAKRHGVDLNTCAILLSDLEFLKNLKVEMRERICKQLTLKTFEPNTIICKQGDTGNRIYGILIGKVLKYQKKITSGLEDQGELRKKLLNTSSLGQIGAGKQARSISKAVRVANAMNKFVVKTSANVQASKFKTIVSSEYTTDPSKCRLQANLLDSVTKIFGPLLEELSPGGTVGSLTLLKQSQLRQFTGISGSTIVDAVTITYDDYNKCVTQFEEEAIKERVGLLHKIALFKNLTKAELKRIIQMGKTIKFAKGQGIMKAEEKSKGCYIILSGEASLTYGNAFMNSKLHSGLKVRPKSAVPLRQSQKDKTRTNADLVQVSLLGPGSYFGEEVLYENQGFEYNVIATKNTEVLVLSLRELTYLSANSNGMVETWGSRIRNWRHERVTNLSNIAMKYPTVDQARKEEEELKSENDENLGKTGSGKAPASPNSDAASILDKVDIKKKMARQKLPKKQNRKDVFSLMKEKGQSKKEDVKDVKALVGIVDGQSWRISSSNIFLQDNYSRQVNTARQFKSKRPSSAKPPLMKRVTIKEDEEVHVADDDYIRVDPDENEGDTALSSTIRDDCHPSKPAARRNSEILAEMRRKGKVRPLSAPPRSSSNFQVQMGIPASFPVWRTRSVTPTGGGFKRIRSARASSARGTRSS